MLGYKIQYTLVDLPEVILLAKKYLTTLNMDDDTIYVNGLESIDHREYDLVISNYAFAELMKPVQNKYIDEIISHSKHGYMVWNSLSYIYGNGYSIDEILKLIPGSYVIEEKPLTAKLRYSLVNDVDNCYVTIKVIPCSLK